MDGPEARDSEASAAAEDLPPGERPGGRPNKAAIFFVAAYFVAVSVATLLLGAAVHRGWVLAIIAAVPAVWAILLALPGILRNPFNAPLAAMQLVLLPLLAAIFIGGPGLLVAMSLWRLFGE